VAKLFSELAIIASVRYELRVAVRAEHLMEMGAGVQSSFMAGLLFDCGDSVGQYRPDGTGYFPTDYSFSGLPPAVFVCGSFSSNQMGQL